MLSTMTHSRNKAAPAGNTLAEYAAIGCTVVIMSIAAFLILGGNLNEHMQGLRDDMAAHILVANQAKAATITDTSAVDGVHQETYFPGARICYSGSICLDMAAVNAQGSVQSTGANGARIGIVMQAGLLGDIAQQMANDPNADQTLVDLVTRLANAGHHVGDSLDQAIAGLSGSGDFYSTYDAFWRSVMPVTDLKNQLDSYVQAHPEAMTPEMKSIVDNATGAISGKAGLLVGAEGPTYENWDTMINAPTPASAGVHEDSNVICNQGGKLTVCLK